MSLPPPQDPTCDYRVIANKTAAKKIARKYTTLIGKRSPPPPIDTAFFRGDKPIKSLLYTTLDMLQVKNGYNVREPPHTDDPVVGIIIVVEQYTPPGGMHTSHAVAAVKYRNTLFAFNAWGISGKPIDWTIFQTVQRTYNCTALYVYRGPSLQKTDPYGVCVGYASNFILEMLVKIYQKGIPAKISKNYYDRFVYTALKTRGICFGSKCVKNMRNRNFFTDMRKNLFTKAGFSPPDLTSSLTVTDMKKIARNHGVYLPPYANKVEILNALKRALPSKRTLANLDHVNFNMSPEKPKPPPKPKSPTVTELKAVAKNRGIKGYSKIKKKENLIKFINLYRTPPKSPTMTQLKAVAKNRGIKGYTKIAKKANLAKFINNHHRRLAVAQL